MPISYLTRIVEFSAAHRVRRADWTPERNAAEFGKAAAEHEHRYQVRVTVRGSLEADRKGVVNLGELDRVLREEITARLDGKVINDAVPEFADGRRLATGEALAVYFIPDGVVGLWQRYRPGRPAAKQVHPEPASEPAAAEAL